MTLILPLWIRVRWNFSCIIETRLVGRNNYRMLPVSIRRCYPFSKFLTVLFVIGRPRRVT